MVIVATDDNDESTWAALQLLSGPSLVNYLL